MELHQLEVEAINAALQNDWQKAIELNQKIVELDPQNLEAYLRLGFALLQKGNYKQAKKAYKKVLEIQPNHPIAKEKLSQLNVLLEKNTKPKESSKLELDPNLFADVPGKTRSVNLVNLGQKHILANLSIGEEVELKIRRRRVEIRTKQGEYIGALPDDLSKRLILFMNAGSKYIAYIKDASLKEITVFIKEVSKGRRVSRFISFPDDMRKNIEYLEKALENKPLENETETTIEEEQQEEEEEVEDIEELAEKLDEYEELQSIGVNVESEEEEEET